MNIHTPEELKILLDIADWCGQTETQEHLKEFQIDPDAIFLKTEGAQDIKYAGEFGIFVALYFFKVPVEGLLRQGRTLAFLAWRDATGILGSAYQDLSDLDPIDDADLEIKRVRLKDYAEPIRSYAANKGVGGINWQTYINTQTLQKLAEEDADDDEDFE